MKLLFRIFIIFLIISSVILDDSLIAQEKEKGKIDDFEKELEKEKDKDSEKKSSAKDSDKDEGNGGSCFFDPELTLAIFYNLFIYSSLLDSIAYNGKFWDCSFSHYPYINPGVGLYSMAAGKRFALNFSGHYFRHNSELSGISLRSQISPWNFLGVEFHLTDLVEELDHAKDHLWLHDIFINYYRVRGEHWALWWGLGLKGIEGNKTHHGVAFNLATEIYPVKPISLHLNYNVGSINEKSVSELLIRLNCHIHRAIIYSGYQRFAVSSAKIDGIIIGIGIYL